MGMNPETMKALREDLGSQCPECKQHLVPKVMASAAGYYVGTSCDCGPYSRESGYYKTREEVQGLLNLFGEG